MTTARKTSYINANCPLALTISPTIDGRFTYSVIDYAKNARVLQKTLPSQEEARTAGLGAAEEYAVALVRETFAAARRADHPTLED